MSIDFEGQELPLRPGDTIASALYRGGVRTFSRSFKYHRPRGLYCVSGDCPNCLVTVDGEVDVRACECAARDGQTVVRQNAWPSVDRDALNVFDKMHRLMPVGFYYKSMAKPKFAWPMAEKIIRKAAGLGFADPSDRPRDLERANRHPDVLVIGAGVAGLAAALGAAEEGARVLLVDENAHPGARVAPGPTRSEIERLQALVDAHAGVERLADAACIGLYEGPLAVVVAPDLVHHVHPQAIVIACGGMETHEVFKGNDLPGVFLARGAARLAGVHGVRPGNRAVVWARQPEALLHARTLADAGVAIAAVVAPPALDASGAGFRVVVGDVVEATGRKRVKAVVVRTSGGNETIECDVLAIGSDIQPNHHLPRLAYDLPCVTAGECGLELDSLDDAAASGRQAGIAAANGLAPYAIPPNAAPRRCGSDGYLCLCEDVEVKDVKIAIAEGFDSAELLKRYTTVTMGPCQGRLCADGLRTVAERENPKIADRVGQPTTLRPPVRPLRLEEAAAGARHHIERHTALHEKHLQAGATTMWAGPWKRIEAYNGDVDGEYWAVRQRVGMIDVGTLGKFLVAGPDVVEFLERVYPMRVADLEPGRLRYGLLLEEGGVIIDDGTVCALEGGAFYLTVTTSGAERLESWMLDWRDAWGLDVFVVNQTSSLGAVNVAGPHARELLQKLSDDALDKESFPYLRHRRITVAGVPCLAMRLGFVGELAYELHFPASRSEELWDRILDAGREWDIRPFGLQAQRLLRLEKGHIIVSQDTDFETTPWKVGMDWAVKLDKPDFVGKAALLRWKERTPRETLVPWQMAPGTAAPPEGATVKVGGQLAGRVTSSWFSPVLGHPLGLAWVRSEHATEGAAVLIDNAPARVAGHALYDPEGVKLRA
jgi:sarcosine oxidase subunit alpha